MGARHRFYLPPAEWTPEPLRLSGEEAHHCVKVFRHQPGDEIEVFDGRGQAAHVRIRATSGRAVDLELQRLLPPQTLPAEITLAQVVPKGKNMDWVIQKAVEIGAAAIAPLESKRSVVKLSGPERKGEKWQRAALEACKQCGRNHLPEVLEYQSLMAFTESDPSELKLVAALTNDAKPLRDILQGLDASPRSVSVVIGPEGDFTEDEMTLLRERGYQAVTLGPTVLRAETAALYALSIISYELF